MKTNLPRLFISVHCLMNELYNFVVEAGRKEILYFENFNLEDIVMPVDADKFDELLASIDYNPEKRAFIHDGFKNGFDLGYRATKKVQITSKNLKLHIGDEIDLWNKVMKEVKLKHYAGPFQSIPQQFEDDFIQSPIGLVPKDNGRETRLIFHLSYPQVKNNNKAISTSVNANTPKDLCSVKYPDFVDAILQCIQEGKSCSMVKSDQTSTFHNLGILK